MSNGKQSQTGDPQASGSTSSTALPHEDKVVIHPYPKIIMFIPTMILAIICGVMASMFADDTPFLELVAAMFMFVFFLNTIIVAFEFPRMAAVAVILLLISITLALLLLNQYFDVIPLLAVVVKGIHMQANAQFYFFCAGVFVFVLCVAWVVSRFDYWEVLNNELLHHHGPFGDLERFPAPQLKLDKEIPDIFEYLVFRSGRLILYPTSERRALFVENVLGINTVERKIKHLLEAMEVRIDKD